MPDPRNPYSQKDCFVKFWKRSVNLSPPLLLVSTSWTFEMRRGKFFLLKPWSLLASRSECAKMLWSGISFLGSWQDKSSEPDSLTWRSLSRLSRVLSSSSYPGVSKSRKYQKTRGKHSLTSSSTWPFYPKNVVPPYLNTFSRQKNYTVP